MTYPTVMTFYQRFEDDILAGKKTITLRDESEKNFHIGSVVDVATFEDNRQFCRVKIHSVIPVLFTELNEEHAEQENMTLPELKRVIQEIYPGISQLYLIKFSLVA